MSKLGYMLEHPVDPTVLVADVAAVKIRSVRAISREVFVTPQRPHAEPSCDEQEVVIWSALHSDVESQEEQKRPGRAVHEYALRSNNMDVRSGLVHHVPDPEHRIGDRNVVDDDRGLTVAPVESDLDAQTRLYAGTPEYPTVLETVKIRSVQEISREVSMSFLGHETPQRPHAEHLNEVMIWSEHCGDAVSQAEQETTWPRVFGREVTDQHTVL